MSGASGGNSAATRGLDGIVVANTEMSLVDGLVGHLMIRGYDVEEIAGRASFEELAYLLWYGALPKRAELEAFNAKLVAARPLPEETEAAITLAAKRMEPMDALRFAVASISADDPNPDDTSHDAGIDRACRILARVPMIVASYQRQRNGHQPLASRDDLGLAANYLYGLTGSEPADAEVKGLNTYLCTVSDHGMNASTFTTRVIASTASDMVSAVVGGIGALKGPLHGGAPGPALDMIEEIGTPDRAEAWMKGAIAQGKRIMGFGHRIYKVRDPRAEVLYKAAWLLAEETGEQGSLDLAREVERVAVNVLEEAKPGRDLNTNVEFYTALLLRDVGLTPDLFSPAFAIGRTVGWTAHIMEHQAGGRLIRPQSEYIGPRDLRYVPVDER